ncbi:MarR family transcriptional regulator [bacterium]|nr:MarR family transcriptional regulator [bacterium]
MKITDETHYINTIYYKIEQAAKYCRHLGTQIFDKLCLHLTLDEFATLDTISLYGEICQRDLAKLILKDRPSTGRILNSLDERGFITRFADTKNNRLVRKMKLTKEGSKILEKASKILKEYLADLPQVLTDSERDNLEHSIQMLKQGLEKEVEMNI